jgi:uncharacterized protein YcsI (UPF0317 family)
MDALTPHELRATADPVTPANPAALTAGELRARIRDGRWTRPTSGCARGFEQCNVIILQERYAPAFEAFCEANWQACPLVETTTPGDPTPRSSPSADIRTDLPRYDVYRDGVLAERPSSIEHVWQHDLVAFLVGCSFSFEAALVNAGIPLRHVAEQRNVAMYRTTLACEPAGPFEGRIVVSMRPIEERRVAKVFQICSRYPRAHGAPLGTDPAALGIPDLQRPDFGQPVAILPGEVPVFWACGVTATEAAVGARLPLLVTHHPGHMFVSDIHIVPSPRQAAPA